ncbi:ODV-EC27 [Plodia interpunctella granulovirus]|uniref:ODV-EC27 n=1 Tax=Plodia interpunctella granulovirus TaxID=262175 RepID=A0A1L5JH74_9BBAC|nr:ODV-EC27 [Plodia interpunctella granulovirus]APO13968.1 ODV-EC27 [Plodia interpunctella granulovirus]
MNRVRTEERKLDSYRTVTEIVDAEDLYQKEFDVADLVNKNEAYLRRQSKREMYLLVAKYITMVCELQLPDMRVLFANSNLNEKLFTLVYFSLAFMNNLMSPHSTQFIDLQFVEIKDRKMAIPAEPIVFYKSVNSDDESQIITCYVDRAGILRILEKSVDINLQFEPDDNTSEMYKLLDRIKTIEQMNKPARPLAAEISKMDEHYVTQLIILMIVFTNAYLGLYKLMRTDFQQYFDYLINHESLIKDRSLSNIQNLFTSYFNFRVSGDVAKKSATSLIFK